MAVIDGVFCLRMGATVHRLEPRFGRHVWVEWDYWQL